MTFGLAAQPVVFSGLGLSNQGFLAVTNSTLTLNSTSFNNTGFTSLTNATINDALGSIFNSGTLWALASSAPVSFLSNFNSITFSGGNVQVFGDIYNAGNIQITKILATFNGFMNDAGTIKTTGETARYLGALPSAASISATPPAITSPTSLVSVPAGSPQDPSTPPSPSDLFVIADNLTSLTDLPTNTSTANVEFQGGGDHQISGNFTFATITIDPGTSVSIIPSFTSIPTTFTVANVVNNGDLQVQAPLAAQAVTNNAGANIQVDASFTANTLSNSGGATLAVNTTQFSTTAPVDNQGQLAINAPINIPLTPTSSGIVTFGTSIVPSATGGVYGIPLHPLRHYHLRQQLRTPPEPSPSQSSIPSTTRSAPPSPFPPPSLPRAYRFNALQLLRIRRRRLYRPRPVPCRLWIGTHG